MKTMKKNELKQMEKVKQGIFSVERMCKIGPRTQVPARKSKDAQDIYRMGQQRNSKIISSAANDI
jgi:hypothetical protein